MYCCIELFVSVIIGIFNVIGCTVVGTVIGSFWDKGTREEGDIRGDFPSTAGFAVGLLVGILVSIVDKL